MSRRQHYQDTSDYSDYIKPSRRNKSRKKSIKKTSTRNQTEDLLYSDDLSYQEEYYDQHYSA